jgi:hypothetical protein
MLLAAMQLRCVVVSTGTPLEGKLKREGQASLDKENNPEQSILYICSPSIDFLLPFFS